MSEVAWEYNAIQTPGFAYYLGDRIPNFFVFNLMTALIGQLVKPTSARRSTSTIC